MAASTARAKARTSLSEGLSPDRDGCFINDEGYANYRATRSGSNVYIGILGTSDDMAALADFAWLGSQDTPGNPDPVGRTVALSPVARTGQRIERAMSSACSRVMAPSMR